MIHDAKEQPDEEMGMDNSYHSTGSSPGASFAERFGHRPSDVSETSWELRRHSTYSVGERSTLLGINDIRRNSFEEEDGENDVESGLLSETSPLPASYKPRRKTPLVPTTATPNSDEALATASNVGSDITASAHEETRSLLTSSEDGTDPTLATSGTKSELDSSVTSRKSRWSRSRDSARSISRSLSRRRSSAARSKRSSIFKKNKQGQADLSASERSGLEESRHVRKLPTYDFLTKEEEDQEGGSLRPGAKWWHGVFVFSLISMLACVITLWAPYPIGARMPSDQIAQMPWSNGCQGGLQSCICPRETICADDLLSMIFLTIARSTAWFDYPLYMLLFMSKANNLNNFLQKTALRCWINFSDYHRVHSLFGIIVGIESTSHTFFHLLRWARRKGDIQLLWTTTTGITGLIAITITPFIVLPMTVPYLKSRMRFEWRKGLHYLALVWGAALMCHAPQRIFWLIGIPVFIYAADKMAEGLFKTHLVESAHFQRLGDTSCLITFKNPPGFGEQNAAYTYLMLPWLSKYQFHAFTVFPSTTPNHSSICIHKCGDWTQKLMKTISTPTHKPAFVVGPFLSPFSSPAMDSENLVAVASGIGVTPAISLIKQYSSTSRRLNLVWICRDAGLVEHFLQNVSFCSDGYTLIYYTGKDRAIILRDELPPNVFIFNGRPDLERTIAGIISSISTGEGLPESLCKKVVTRTPAEMRTKLLLEKALSIYTIDQLFDYSVKASNYHNEGLEPLVDIVNYQGVLSTMKHLLSDDCELVVDKITQNFERIDADGDCRIDHIGFEHFFNLMLASMTDSTQEVADIKRGLQRMSTTRDMFESGRKNLDSESKDEFGIKKHLQGDGKFSAQNWNMLYCGGSQPVLDQLKAFKRKFGVELAVEKFDW
jgi:hypothetical protein